jgi:hypothetical protein
MKLMRFSVMIHPLRGMKPRLIFLKNCRSLARQSLAAGLHPADLPGRVGKHGAINKASRTSAPLSTFAGAQPESPKSTTVGPEIEAVGEDPHPNKTT